MFFSVEIGKPTEHHHQQELLGHFTLLYNDVCLYNKRQLIIKDPVYHVAAHS